MDNILDALKSFHQSTLFTASLPYLRLALAALVGACYVMALHRDDLLSALRQAIADAGMSEKQVGTGSKSLLSMKLSGQRPLTFDALAQMPEPVIQWFLVRVAERVGVPATIAVGARLHRQQARMSLSARKAGVA